MGSGIFICGPTKSLNRRRIIYCPVEKRRRRMVANYGGYWGVMIRCCGCGDAWQDGELLERPFAPKWRERVIRRAKADYEAAPSGPPPSMCEQGVCPDECWESHEEAADAR